MKFRFISIIFISFLIFSNTPLAAQINETREDIKHNELNDTIYVDPSVKLNSARMYDLEKIVKNIDDKEYKLFLIRILEELKEKGSLNAEDIKAIADEYEFTNSWIVRPGILTGYAGYDVHGVGFPFCFHPFLRMISWRGPGLFFYWDCSEEFMNNRGWDIKLDLHFNSIELNYHHKGLALFQFGHWRKWQYFDYNPIVWGASFLTRFVSPIVIISPDN